MNVIFIYLRIGVINQSISIYHVDEPAKQLSLIKTIYSSLEDLENSILKLTKEFNTEYINILNDKMLQKEIAEKYNLKEWEELF